MPANDGKSPLPSPVRSEGAEVSPLMVFSLPPAVRSACSSSEAQTSTRWMATGRTHSASLSRRPTRTSSPCECSQGLPAPPYGNSARKEPSGRNNQTSLPSVSFVSLQAASGSNERRDARSGGSLWTTRSISQQQPH